MTSEERQRIERECLEQARSALTGWMPPEAPHRIRDLRLEGTYPETRIVVTGDRTYGGEWRVRFPIWEGNGGTKDGQPMPSFIGMLVYTEVLEA